jgi:hypothetical protein
MTCARGRRHSGGPDAGDPRSPGGINTDPAVGVDVAAQAGEQRAVRDEPRADEERVSRNDAAVVHLHSAQAVVLVNDEFVDGAFDDDDGSSEQFVAVAVGTVQDVAGPPRPQTWDVRQFVVQAGRHSTRRVKTRRSSMRTQKPVLPSRIRSVAVPWTMVPP